MWPFSSNKRQYTLTPTQELLLALLRAQLWLTPVDDITLPSTVEAWDELLNLGYKQTVICFVAAACLRHKDVDSIPSEIREELEAVIEENRKIHQQHNAILIELITKFESQGLHPILLKGQGIAQMYDYISQERRDQSMVQSESTDSSLFTLHSSLLNKPLGNSSLFTLHSSLSELRQCGDIDFYFRTEEYEEAKAYIQSVEDEQSKRHEDYKHYDSLYKGVEIEVHRRTMKIANPYLNKEWQQYTEQDTQHIEHTNIAGKEVNILPSVYNVTYSLLHLLHHFEKHSISLRQLSDMAMLFHHYSNSIDRNRLTECISHYDALRFYHILTCVLVESLGLPQSDAIDYDTSKSMDASWMLAASMEGGSVSYYLSHGRDNYSNYIVRKIRGLHRQNKKFYHLYHYLGSHALWQYASMKGGSTYKWLFRRVNM